MWICPECNTNVNDENLSCEVCGAARKPLRYDSTLFSSLEEPVIVPATGATQNAFRRDLACVLVRGFGLYLVIQALFSVPEIIWSIFAVSEFANRFSVEVNTSSGLRSPFNSVLAALIAKNVLMLVGGLFFLTSDLMIRLLARPAKS